MRKAYSTTTIFHSDEKEKRIFTLEVQKRFPSYSAMARAIVQNPDAVFNPNLTNGTRPE